MTNRNALASVSHRDHSGLDGIMAMEFFATQFISLHILPNLRRCHREWVNVAIVSLSIVEDNVASRHRFTINLLVAHRFGDEAVKFADHRVSSVWVDLFGSGSGSSSNVQYVQIQDVPSTVFSTGGGADKRSIQMHTTGVFLAALTSSDFVVTDGRFGLDFFVEKFFHPYTTGSQIYSIC